MAAAQSGKVDPKWGCRKRSVEGGVSKRVRARVHVGGGGVRGGGVKNGVSRARGDWFPASSHLLSQWGPFWFEPLGLKEEPFLG